jgi:hypothetical protein
MCTLRVIEVFRCNRWKRDPFLQHPDCGIVLKRDLSDDCGLVSPFCKYATIAGC